MNKKTVQGAIAIGTAVLLAVPVFAPVHQAVALPPPEPMPESQHLFGPEVGRATWYGDKFQGHNTASGNRSISFK